MSAETIPAEVVKLARRVVLHCQNTPPEEATKIVERVIASAFTRPAEPAATVAEAGDGEVSRYIAKCREMSRGENGHTYTWWSRLADLLSTLEAERARADAAEQRAADALARAEKAEGAGADDRRRLDWLEANTSAVISHEGFEDDVWQIHTVSGNRSDLEWTKRAEADTVREAIDAAIRAIPPRASREAQPATDGGEA